VLRAELLLGRGVGVIAARADWRDLEAKLRPFVARRVRAAHDVDDVLQDVFVKMQRGLAELRDEERFGPWVYRVARSAIVDHQRVAARHPLPASPSDDVVAQPIVHGDYDEERAAERQLAGAVAAFIARLRSPYREALTLTELEGLTQKEAAEMLGLSLSGMKSRVQRGRLELKRALEACCEILLDVRGRVVACEPRDDGERADACCAPRD
jgi:RNA polymerase sigma-70 factor (ECF subfamily)